MGLANVELYEALKPSVGEDAARMIAEVLPAAPDLATKTDIAELRAEMHEGFARQTRWMLGMFIPVWAGTWATTVAVILKG